MLCFEQERSCSAGKTAQRRLIRQQSRSEKIIFAAENGVIMVKIITGNKGSGKTKILIDMINAASQNTDGYVVCIDKSDKLRYDIPHSVRIVDTDVYRIYSFEAFFGLVAGNYDIKDIFVDSILKVGGADYDALGALLAKIDKLTGNDVNVVFTVSADKADLPESVTKYAIK